MATPAIAHCGITSSAAPPPAGAGQRTFAITGALQGQLALLKVLGFAPSGCRQRPAKTPAPPIDRRDEASVQMRVLMFAWIIPATLSLCAKLPVGAGVGSPGPTARARAH